jgi:putative ubiquitin-RnfH superfamily antitoxin RatB of RatAB toxin-antitoxin module
MAAPVEGLPIEVAHARPGRQWVLPLVVPAGTSVRGAVLASPLGRECPGLDLATAPLGVWGERVADDRPVRAGDRVEVYRELARDPRAARRAAVARGGTLGRGRPPG